MNKMTTFRTVVVPLEKNTENRLYQNIIKARKCFLATFTDNYLFKGNQSYTFFVFFPPGAFNATRSKMSDCFERNVVITHRSADYETSSRGLQGHKKNPAENPSVNIGYS